MGQPNAKKGDRVVGLDTHIVMMPSPAGSIPTPMPMAFSGTLENDLSDSVFVSGQPAAIVGSSADNSPQHIPSGGPFQNTPGNKGTVSSGSGTVFASNVAVARNGDPVECCNDPSDSDTGHIIASGTVTSG